MNRNIFLLVFLCGMIRGSYVSTSFEKTTRDTREKSWTITLCRSKVPPIIVGSLCGLGGFFIGGAVDVFAEYINHKSQNKGKLFGVAGGIVLGSIPVLAIQKLVLRIKGIR